MHALPDLDRTQRRVRFRRVLNPTIVIRNLPPLTEKPNLDEYATVAETCALLGVSAAWVYQLIRMGGLEAVRYKRLNYVTRASIRRRIEDVMD